MISVIITTYKESKTIGRAIDYFFNQKIKEKFEIIVMCGDKETFDIAKSYSSSKKIFVYMDKAEGKPAALNLALKKSKGDVLVLSDGDVFIGQNSLKYLIEPFKNATVGATCGHPIPVNSRKSMFGFWAQVLTYAADKGRLKAVRNKKRFFCSGYLFAIKRDLFPILPEEILSEDGFISQKVYEKNYEICYCPKSRVYVKYPDNFSDWIKQKKRSVGGYNQIKKLTGVEMRSFKKEAIGGITLFRFVCNLTEFIWLLLLFIARIYLWILIYRDINLRKKKHKEIWVRVESTK